MNYLFLLSTLALIGAGCVTNPNIQPSTTDSEQPAPAEQTQEITTDEEGGEEALDDEAIEPTNETDKTISSENLTTLTTDDGLTVIVKDTDASDDEKNDEDNVPVTDIVLGGATQNVTMEAVNFFFSPKTIEAKPGEKINIFFSKNVGFHTFVIDELNVKFAIKEGEGLIFQAPTEPGSYAFYCDIGSHRANGMEGTLIVK